MKIVIIEDEMLAAQRLQQMLCSIEAIEVLQVLDTVKNAVAYFQTAPAADLLFMDIQLGDGKSFEILEQVKVDCPIIFVTAFDEFAIKAFNYNSIGYLVKPIKKEDLEGALAKYKNQQRTVYDYKALANFLHKAKTEEREVKTRFLVKKGSHYLSVNVNDVAHAYTKDRLHFIKTFSNVDYIIDTNLDELETQLDSNEFFRVNRQFLVAHSSINQVLTWFDGKLKLTIAPAAYEDIVISRLRATDFKRWLDK